MEFLKSVFGDKAMTYQELSEAIKDNKEIKLANLAGGQYVDKSKLDGKIQELATANQTIADLQGAVKKFDGVDIEKLKGDLTTLQSKYDSDIANAKLDNALGVALLQAKAKNPKLIKAALNMDLIKLDGDKLLGFDEQLNNLKTSEGYLFEDTADGADKQNSAGEHSGGASGLSGVEAAFYAKNPDLKPQ